MKCTKCGLRDATTEVTLRRNDKVEKMYLCGECAKTYRPDIGLDSLAMLNKFVGSPMGLLSDLTNLFNAPTTRALVCPDCKTTSEEFLKTGFVGCPHCYEVFEPLIVQTGKRLQQSDRHVGKTPHGAEYIATEEARLKAELQAAVDSGDYARLSELGEKLKKLVAGRKEDA